MKLGSLIKIADTAYPDGMVLQAHQAKGKKVGDGLAEFIANELAETFEPGAKGMAQIDEAIRVMTNARDQVNLVLNAFIDKTIDK
jgi:hypothetical protein